MLLLCEINFYWQRSEFALARSPICLTLLKHKVLTQLQYKLFKTRKQQCNVAAIQIYNIINWFLCDLKILKMPDKQQSFYSFCLHRSALEAAAIRRRCVVGRNASSRRVCMCSLAYQCASLLGVCDCLNEVRDGARLLSVKKV